jgi:hypothetical protein
MTGAVPQRVFEDADMTGAVPQKVFEDPEI